MKKIIPILIALFTGLNLLSAQAPQAINYQAVARDISGAILTNQDISIRITILKDSISGLVVYQETHSLEVNSFGLINLAIGTGAVISGNFSLIEWDTSAHYLKVEIDPDADSNYFDLGATQLLSVPYSLESKHTSSLTLTDENGHKYEIKVDTSGNLISDLIEIIPNWNCGDIMVDTSDGQEYTTIQIGSQCWMAENLNVGTKINSTVGWFRQTNNGIIEKYCYNNDTANCEIYGGLYEWPEAMQYVTTSGTQGICPAGWHLPTDAEWITLTSFLGGWSITGGKLKSTGTLEDGTGLWHQPNTGATNESGFTGLPGGNRLGNNGNFSSLGSYGAFWSSSQYNTINAIGRGLNYNDADVDNLLGTKMSGYSIRCLRICSQANAGVDQLGIPDTSTTLAGNIPAEGTNEWHIVSGTGGIIDDILSPTSGFHGLAGNAYSLTWTIRSVCGISVDTVQISFSASSFTCGDDYIDVRDGQSYTTVLIGTQCWMAENMNAGTKINSTSDGYEQTNNGIIEKYCYNNDLAQCDIYGGLYEWTEAMQYFTIEGGQGICPGGWHIPTDNELKILTGTVDSQYPVGDTEWNLMGSCGLDAGGNLKETGTTHWNPPNTGATNSSGFTGLPGGHRQGYDGYFSGLGIYGYFWSSSQNNMSDAWLRSLTYDLADIYRDGNPKWHGFSIRCLKND